jgi:hypothetical protein
MDLPARSLGVVLHLAVVTLVLAGSTGPMAWAQEVETRNVQAYQQGNRVVVTYAVIGDTGAEYEVALRVSDDGGRSFRIEPSAVSGAIGENVEPGGEKKIVWDVLEDFPGGLEGDDYKFKVIARNVGVDEAGSFGIGTVASSGLGNQTGTVCCGMGGRLLWDLSAYPVELSLDLEYWERVRVNRLSSRIRYMYNEKIIDVGIYNTFSFGDLNIHRAGIVIDSEVSLYNIHVGPSIKYPLYFSILNGDFSEFSLDKYAIFGSSITIRF